MSQATAVSAPAARGISRADILQAGRGGSPWAFLPVALQALRARPDDHELRFLAAAAFAKLMLVTPARWHLGLLPGELRGQEPVRALGAAIDRLPSDRIGVDDLLGTLAGNLLSLRDRKREPVDLAGSLSRWREHAAAWEWLRARDGNIVRRRAVDAAGLNEQWIGLADLKGAIDGLTLPHKAATDKGGNVPPYVLEGIDPPWLVARVLRETPRGADGYHARVTIVQEDALELMDGLAQADLSELLREDRVRVLVGPDVAERLSRVLAESMDTQITGPGLSMSTVRVRVSPTIESVMQHAQRNQLAEQQRLAAEVERVYGAQGGRDRAWWARRLAAKNGDAPRRVLIPTCRFSTYIKHSSADLAAAFERMGWESRVLIEPDEHSHLSGVAYYRAIAEFRPDLVVMINYARANINGSQAPVIHLNIPYVMWVQDAMPHQMDRRIGDGMGGLDFVAGNVREELFRTFGYPRERTLNAPIVASAAKFHPGEPSRELRERHSCEIAYVSHHCETPEAMHDRKRREAASNPALVDLIDRIHPGLGPIVANPLGEPISTRLRTLTAQAMDVNPRSTTPEQESTIAQVVQVYAMPMADRMLRHETLAWAAKIAQRRGWRLHLYGRGWEKHPTLAVHARGELDHGEDLRACYHVARVHLQVSAHTVLHQRLAECALSGGLPISRAQEDDLSTLMHWAAVRTAAARLAEGHPRASGDCCDPWTVLGTRYRRLGYPVAECPEAMAVTSLRERLGLRADEWIWLNSSRFERLEREGGAAEELPPHRSLFAVLGDPAEYMFADREEMERMLVRAVEDEDWRSSRVHALRERVLGLMTDESFARDLVAFVAAGLKR